MMYEPSYKQVGCLLLLLMLLGVTLMGLLLMLPMPLKLLVTAMIIGVMVGVCSL